MRSLYTIILLLSHIIIFAQTPECQILNDYKCIDSTSIELRYEFKHKNHHTQKDYKDDIRIVQIGRKTVKEYSETIFHYDSLATENVKKGKNTYKGIPDGIYPYEFFAKPKERTIDVKCRMTMDIGTLCYQTKLPNLVWNYSSDDITEISGYSCNKATTVYAGREYVAWYTLDVPVHYGLTSFLDYRD